MTNIIKHTVVYLFNLSWGFGITYLLPTVLMTAFNLLKGPVNNSEGEVFQPIGCVLLILMLLVTILLILLDVKVIRTRLFASAIPAVSVTCCIAGLIAGIIVINSLYSANYTNMSDWLVFG